MAILSNRTSYFLRALQSCLCLFALQGWAADTNTEIPRNEYGQPDMQGIWFYGTATPFERPINLGEQKIYSNSEAETVLKSLADADDQKRQPINPELGAPEQGSSIGQEADHNFAISRTNWVYIDGSYRTSQIIHPSNGRLPYKKFNKDFFELQLSDGHGAYDGPESRPASERCVGPTAGPLPPMISWFYNANMQIVQTRDYAVIVAEMNHDARIIPLIKHHKYPVTPKWLGNSIGHWENDKLVVNTVGIRQEQSWFAFKMSDQLSVSETFELISKDEILYRYTFTDPKIYDGTVTVEKKIVRRNPGEPILEFACHEGNYSLPNILAGARREEE